ncbi:hypothetical protein [Prescottella subtropica]|uniref:hypothetical protein n=1 Tax=Prescottella subtropica TaxID=2545757 RepID=UPI0010F731A8|nr:hypothetical protein [Prescottella subtropica]
MVTLRAWHLRTGAVVLTWLVALVVVAAANAELAQSHWLMIHLLGLGAASNAILIWSWYFTEAVLRLSHSEQRRPQGLRLVLFNAGALAVVVGYGSHGTGARFVVLAGALAALAAIAWHVGALLRRLATALPSRFGPIVRYYVASGACLLVGIGFGAALASGTLPGSWSPRLAVAHAAVNVLGWIGLTVIGTLVTLWPTILRTRMAAGVERAAVRGLPVLIGAVAVVVAGALTGILPVAAAGIAGYAAALGYVAWAHADEVRRKHPTSFAALSVLAGLVWLLVTLIVLAVGYVTAPDWFAAEDRLATATTALLGGFLAQVLLGALSYLIPVVVGNRPSATQAATAVLDTAGPARVAAANAGLLVWALPGTGLPSTLCAAVAVAALAGVVPLTVRAVLVARRPVDPDVPRRRGRRPDPATGVLLGSGAAGLAVVVVAAALGVAADPAAVGLSGRTGTPPAAASGHTTRVDVSVAGMRFVPDRLAVPAGNRLVITLTNTGDRTHDLVLSGGARTPRLSPGGQATVDAGVITGSGQGWCSVAGHRQMGMVLDITVEPSRQEG